MKTIFHPANERGSADHGWLKVNHSFSFANWYNPEKVHFGNLRVLNDDTVAPGKGFGTHPHDNMEIITIPLEGQLAHKDSMGNASTINAGEIQVMSAGSGVQHSEFNPSADTATNLFQIWIFPNKRNVEPRYDQFKIDENRMQNQWLQLVSPNKDDDGTWIYQDAYLSMGRFPANETIQYSLHHRDHGVYLMVVEGEVTIGDQKMQKRDAIGITDTDALKIKTQANSRLLLIEVPMRLPRI